MFLAQEELSAGLSDENKCPGSGEIACLSTVPLDG